MPAPSRRRHARCPLRAQRAAGCSARAPWPAATTHCSANTRAAYLRMAATPSQDASHARRASRAIAHPAVSRVTGTVQSERHARRHGRSAKPSPRRPLGPPSSVDLTVASSARQCRRKLSCRIFHLRQGTRLPRRGCSLRIPRYAATILGSTGHTYSHPRIKSGDSPRVRVDPRVTSEKHTESTPHGSRSFPRASPPRDR